MCCVCVTVITSSSNSVSKLNVIMEFSFLFSLIQELYNPTKKCESYVENNVVSFYGKRYIQYLYQSVQI